MTRLRLAIVTSSGHPGDVAVWSGIPAHVVAELGRRDVDVTLIGPLGRWHMAGRIVSGLTKRLPGGRKVNWEVEPKFLRAMTRSMRRALAARPVDAILAMGWIPYPDHPPGTAVWYWGDGTYGQRLDEAPHWSNLGARSRRRVPRVEGTALRGLTGVIMSSQWAADDAVDRYAVPPDRVHVVPFGANLTVPEPARRQLSSELRLLTVGVDWHRKGMDIAVLAADALRAKGVPATLDVVGARPPDRTWQRPYVTYRGFLSKDRPGEATELASCFAAADLFLLPSRHDLSPMVLAEAAAHSLPAVATAVGGVAERMVDGVSGLMLPAGAGPDELAACVADLWSDPGRYERLSGGARRHFESAASWSVAIDRLLAVLHGGAPERP